MRKKLFHTVLALACALTCAFSLAACKQEEPVYFDFKLNADNQSYTVSGRSSISKDKLTEVVIPSEHEGKPVTVIGKFDGSDGVTKFVIPDSVTRIEKSAFWSCADLESITIPDSVTSIGEDAFKACYKLLKTENGVSYVNNWAVAFESSANYTTVSLKKGIKIADYAFGSTYISEVTLPEDLTRIPDGAFPYTEKIKTITVPASVVYIGKDAFKGLHSFTFEGTVEQWKKVAFGSNTWNKQINSQRKSFPVVCSDGTVTYAYNNAGEISEITAA